MSESSSQINRVYHLIKENRLFCGASVETLDKMAQNGKFRQASKNSIVFYQSDPADTVYLVCSGSITIFLSSSDGRELLINRILPGNWFGEVAVITHSARSATAMAFEKSELLVIPGQVFLELLSTDRQVAYQFIQAICMQLIGSSLRESALAFLDAPGRIARVLLEMDNLNGDKGYITMSQDELAQRTGLTRQTVAKFLGRWRRAGWLLTGRGHIMLLNRAMLQRMG